jgi:hexulose-6-phosphate isomerase
VISKLLGYAVDIGADTVVVPLFDESAISHVDMVIKPMFEIIKNSNTNIRIALEGNFGVQDWVDMMSKIDNLRVGICYDVGNATGLGCDVCKEVLGLIRYIFEFHLKDKKKGGESVMLGEGDVPFADLIHALRSIDYEGTYVLESYFGSNAAHDTIKNHTFFQNLLSVKPGVYEHA